MSAWYNRPTIIKKIAADQRVWFISDLHLGDGTPCDVFFGKDNHLIALIERVEREGAVLVIAGDAIDFHQAWSFTRVLRAHQELFAALTRLGREGRLFYVIGNHDYDLSLFNELLSFQVCDELHIGREILVRHGWQYDPYLSKSLGRGHQWSTTIHHLIERYFGTWLRIPLGEFYTLGNRFVFWLGHKVYLFAHLWETLQRSIGGSTERPDGLKRYFDYWAHGNMGDPMGMFRPAYEHLQEGQWRYIVCGHSHVPGVVPGGKGAYINTGSWTFASSHYALWDGDQFSAHDWLTGREFTHEFYEPLLDGYLYEIGFEQWWTSNYMGLLRFREGEERLGRLRGWESLIRDHQRLSHLTTRSEPSRNLHDESPPP